jgi:hypothetical protein
VFSTTEEGKAEIMNIAQYAVLAIIPIVLLNKTIQRFIPDADQDASTIELLAEVVIQVLIIFIGLVIIHRIISYVPTYSGYRYEPFILTNAILTFLVIVLSLQTKLGLKVNMLFDRVMDLWTGGRESGAAAPRRMGGGGGSGGPVQKPAHMPRQADMLDANPSGVFPPQPMNTSNTRSAAGGGGGGGGGWDNMYSTPNVSAAGSGEYGPMSYGPVAANGLIGSSFR